MANERILDYSKYFWQDDMVRLRAMCDEDWQSHYHNRFDTPARRLLNCMVELPPTFKEAHDMVDIFKDFDQSKGRIMFSIETLDGELVGGINLNSIDERNGTFSIGMQIDKDHRGKGLGTAAMGMVLKYAFLERRLNKYFGHVLEGNVASATMLKKLGCQQEGVRRQMIYTDGRYHDEILFGLTLSEYLSLNG